MLSKSKICFFFQEVTVSLASRSILKNFILRIFKKEGRKLEFVNFIFCTDKILLKINQDYLNHDFYTDIITFDLSKNKTIQAEIYISIDRIRENARKLGVSFKSELHRVVFHGVLHLCGYKDKNMGEKKKMREKEEFYLAAFLN